MTFLHSSEKLDRSKQYHRHLPVLNGSLKLTDDSHTEPPGRVTCVAAVATVKNGSRRINMDTLTVEVKK